MKNFFNIIVTIVIGFFLTDYLKKQSDKIKVRNLDIKDPGNPNYQIWITGVAEALYHSMNKVGTDEQRIFDLFENLTKSDYEAVKKAFGSRGYDNLWGTSDDKKLKRDLDSWLKAELSKNEYDKLIKNLK